MALESGTYVSDLVTTNPTSTDPRAQGDDHIRLLKTVLRTTFPNADRAFRFPEISNISTSVALLSSDDGSIIFVDTTAGPRSITLPSGFGSGDKGWSIRAMKTDASANSAFIIPATGLINGAASIELATRYDAVEVFWGGTQWIAEVAGAISTAKLLDHAVTNAKLAQMNAGTVKMNKEAVLGDVEDVAIADLQALLTLFNAAVSTQGLVPGRTAAEATAKKVLLADGTWGFTGAPAAALAERTNVGVDNGDGVTSAWTARGLNVEIFDPFNVVTVAAGVFTLQPGTYIIEWWAKGTACNGHMTRLAVSGGASVEEGTSGMSQTGGTNTDAHSFGIARVTPSVATPYVIQSRMTRATLSNGFGQAAGVSGGVKETYCLVKIWRA